jgi:hypothetical protein
MLCMRSALLTPEHVNAECPAAAKVNCRRMARLASLPPQSSLNRCIVITISERAVKSPAYVLAALKAPKRGVRTPPEDDHLVRALLRAAKEAMMEEESLYNDSLMPFGRTALQNTASYQDVTSKTSWNALQVLPAPRAARMPCRHCLSLCTVRTNCIVIMQE